MIAGEIQMNSRMKLAAAIVVCILLMIGTACADMTLPDNLTIIADQAFMYDTGLLGTLTIPEGVKTIGKEAFYGCTGIDTLIIPYSVERIENKAFASCPNLAGTVVLPYNCYVAEDAFDDCDNLTVTTVGVTSDVYFTYQVMSYGAVITDYYSGGPVDVVIPDTLDGAPVAKIFKNAFKGNTKLRSVVIPSTVTTIDEYAFSGCTKLTSVVIPESVTAIEDYAFSDCRSLVNITIPQSITRIDPYTFKGCYGLKHVQLPTGLNAISAYAFSGCRGLESIYLPDSISTLGANAFSGCTKLWDVHLPLGWKTTVNITASPFTNCTSLTDVLLPYGMTEIPDYAFYDCKLTQIRIPDSVTTIGWSAFGKCSALQSVRFSVNTTLIERYAFSDCYNLTSVVLPASLKTIEPSVFANCSKLVSVRLPEGLNEISVSVFQNCTSLESIHLPDSLTILGGGAFSGCSNLKEVNYPRNWTYVGYISSPYSPFVNCPYLTSIDIPEGITLIPAGAFKNWTLLTGVDIPEGVTDIGEEAFSGCTGLTSIKLPESTRIIQRRAFQDCSNLTDVKLPEGLEEIGVRTFSNCTSLTEIHLPDNVTTLKGYVFAGCTSLRTVNCPKYWTYTSVLWEDQDGSPFADCAPLTTIELPYGLKTIPEYGFAQWKNLTSIELPMSLRSLGDHAFYWCTGLKSIVLPRGITSIERYTFQYCSSMTQIHIPATVTSINKYAFYGCSSLTTIYGEPGSYAETYAQENGYKFEIGEFPSIEDLMITSDYFKVTNAYSYNGDLYWEAELTRDHNGVKAGNFFFTDMEGNPVADPALISKLWTIWMYAKNESMIDSNINNLYGAAKIWSSTAKDFMGKEAMWSALGSATGAVGREIALAYASGGVSFLRLATSAVAENILDGNEVSAWLQAAVINRLLDYMDEIVQFTNTTSGKDPNGVFEYDDVYMKLCVYVNYLYAHDVAEGLCMPIVDKIIKNFENDTQVAMHLLGTMMFETVSSAFPIADACLTVIKGVATGDINFFETLDTLLSTIEELDPFAQTVLAVSKHLTLITETLSTISGVKDSFVLEENDWLAPYFKTPAELLDTPLYENHLKLAQ